MQCSIPVFDGLLPKRDNEFILTLLFLAAHWHGLAKLRLHTDPTLEVLDAVTGSLGRKLRDFRDRICIKYSTCELPKEARARNRRQANKSKAPKKPSPSKDLPDTSAEQEGVDSLDPTLRTPKTINLDTYTLHSLGDYATSIRQFGTSDSYSTEPVSGNSLVMFCGVT